MIPCINESDLWNILEELIDKEIGVIRPQEASSRREKKGKEAKKLLKTKEPLFWTKMKEEGNICHAILQIKHKYPDAVSKMGHHVADMKKMTSLMNIQPSSSKKRKESIYTGEEKETMKLTALIMLLIKEEKRRSEDLTEEEYLRKALEAVVMNQSKESTKRFTVEDLQMGKKKPKQRRGIRGLSQKDQVAVKLSLEDGGKSTYRHNNIHEDKSYRGTKTMQVSEKEILENLDAPHRLPKAEKNKRGEKTRVKDRKLTYHAELEAKYENFTMTSEGARKYSLTSNKTEEEEWEEVKTILNKAKVDQETIEEEVKRINKNKKKKKKPTYPLKNQTDPRYILKIQKCLLCSLVLGEEKTFRKQNQPKHQLLHKSLGKWTEDQKDKLIVPYIHILTP